ncbi:hypothetical protein J2Z21_002838 [Streptomyces griseochromogenes]|uniref:Uncharacterized protein n=1 Tax=Streptomyces griseochromogenes TaxID=68214 RepID=A0ABS4LR68_9ACTN|nr:hypothetical protein [Streptomyces griseochromogenes]MBP2049902.1 hypothetical protein [Streptomyces griseochromogenes]
MPQKSTRLRQTGLALGATLLLLGCLTFSAQAAPGEFEYLRADNNKPDTISDPSLGCRSIPGGAANASNRTSFTATVYTSLGCGAGKIKDIAPNGGTWNGAPLTVAGSVKFS